MNAQHFNGAGLDPLPISYFVPATLAVMMPFFFLVRTFLLTPFWLDSADGKFTGDDFWSSMKIQWEH